MNQPASMRRCRGLTLVELLAVIAIIGLLVGLLMPALQSARETSRRTTCAGNLKTLALASLSHLEHIGTFPSGGSFTNSEIKASNGFAEEQGGGFFFNILPFMELESLRNLPGDTAKRHAPPVIGCPTTLVPGSVAVNNNNPTLTLGIACYSGSYGSQPRGGTVTTGTLPDGRTVQIGGTRVAGAVFMEELSKAEREAAYPTFVNYGHRVGGNGSRFNDGVICTFGRVRAAHVTDGLGNTLLCAEKPVRAQQLSTYTNDNPADWAADNGGGWTGGWGWWTPSGGQAPRKFIQGSGGNPVNIGWFGSRHDTTFGTAYCDGSVRHLGFEVDAVNVWPQLSSRNGRENVAVPW